MRGVSLFVAIVLTSTPAFAQERAPNRASPIQASIDKAAAAAAGQAPPMKASPSGGKSKLFWSGLVVGIAGATTSALGLTVFRTEDSSTGNAPQGTYLACVAQRDSNPIYAGNQCDALKGKNLKLLWGGVALGGVGTAMMIGGLDTSAEISPGAIAFLHRLRF
jgi:hypothetical protein